MCWIQPARLRAQVVDRAFCTYSSLLWWCSCGCFVSGAQNYKDATASVVIHVPSARVRPDSPPAHCQFVCCLLSDVCAAAGMLYGVLFVWFVCTVCQYTCISSFGLSVCLSVCLGDRASVLVCLSAASHALEAVSAPIAWLQDVSQRNEPHVITRDFRAKF